MLGDEIRKRRNAAGISQEELAERAAVHRTYISDLERNLKSPTVAVLLRICSALNVHASTLISKIERSGKT